MYTEKDGFRFKSGKDFYANNNIVGISPDLCIYEGYDGGIDSDDMTTEEKLELADYMIGLWGKFKQQSQQ